MDTRRTEPGWIEVITGSMFSGKSEELIRRLRRAQIARQTVQIFKPRDRQPLQRGRRSSRTARCRSPSKNVRDSRRAARRRCGRTPRSSASTRGSSSTPSCRPCCSTLADEGKRVIVAGLDQDYLGKPFEPMPQLLAIAEYITKTLAICMVCGGPGEPHAAAGRVAASACSSAPPARTRRAAGTASTRHYRRLMIGDWGWRIADWPIGDGESPIAQSPN